MDGYWIWLAFLALTVISSALFSFRPVAIKTAKGASPDADECKGCRIRSGSGDAAGPSPARTGTAQIKEPQFRSENELKKTKRTIEYESSERLQCLESYVAGQSCNPSAVFLSTFSSSSVLY